MGKSIIAVFSLLAALVGCTSVRHSGAEFKGYGVASSASVRALAGVSKPMPDPTEVDSTLPSVDDSIGGMWVSDPYEPSVKDGVFPDTDPLKLESDDLWDFLDGRGEYKRYSSTPNAKKAVIEIRYGLSDPSFIDALIEAKKRGFERVIVITDLNNAMDADFKPEERDSLGKVVRKAEASHNDFKRARPKPGEAGELVRRLLDAGFAFNDPKYGIFSLPFYNKNDGDMDPLMHQKETYKTVRTSKGLDIFQLSGTANLNNNPRYNRVFEGADPIAAAYCLKHAEAMMRNFAKGGQVHHLKFDAPLKINYPDGSSQGIAYTDGRLDVNRRISDLINAAAQDPQRYKIKRIVLSHFVLTDGDTVKAIRALLEAQPQVEVVGIFDAKFFVPYGWGMGPAMVGYNVYREFGGTVFGFPSRLRRLIKIKAYQRKAEGRVETDPEGPPLARHLWHDKTSLIEGTFDGVEKAFVATGSMNLSNKYENAEMQTWYEFPAKSRWVEAIAESVMKVVDAQPEYAIDGELAIFREFVASLTGHSVFEVSLAEARGIIRNFQRGELRAAKDALRAIAMRPTTLHRKLSLNEVRDRVVKLTKFVEWYVSSGLSEGRRGLSARQTVAAGMGLAWPAIGDYGTKQSIQSALWSPKLKDAALDEKAREAWKEMGFDRPYPERRASKKPGVAEAASDEVVEGLAFSGGSGGTGKDIEGPGIYVEEEEVVLGIRERCESPLIDPLFRR